MPKPIPKKMAVKKLTRMPAQPKRFADIQSVNRGQAYVKAHPGAGPQQVASTSLAQYGAAHPPGATTVSPSTTTTTPTTPQEDTTRAQLKSILRKRLGKSFERTQYNQNPMSKGGKPPTAVNKDNSLYMQAFKRRSRRRGAFR